MPSTIYTIGHSTRSFEDFLSMLRSFDIRTIADIRAYPGSHRYPHFNKDSLEHSLPAAGIRYIHFKELGGRRKPAKYSHNTAWRNDAFRGYADHMETDEFRTNADKLMKYAGEAPLTYMCSEAVWWRCHRALVSDFLKIRNWNVMHIMGIGKS